MLPDYFEFSLPTRVIYGIGIINQLNDAVAYYGSRRALLVTRSNCDAGCLDDRGRNSSPGRPGSR